MLRSTMKRGGMVAVVVVLALLIGASPVLAAGGNNPPPPGFALFTAKITASISIDTHDNGVTSSAKNGWIQIVRKPQVTATAVFQVRPLGCTTASAVT